MKFYRVEEHPDLDTDIAYLKPGIFSESILKIFLGTIVHVLKVIVTS